MTGALALGLVSYSTSDPRSTGSCAFAALAAKHGAGAAHAVDAKQNRLRRMKTGVLTNARLSQESINRNGCRSHAVMVTLTYRPGEEWRARHISAFMHCARQWHKRRKVKMRVVWVAEMQQRGAVHYHAIFWLPKHLWMPKPDKRGWWPNGSSEIAVARNAVGYVAKYASKGADGPAFPPGVRIHGACGLDANARLEARWWRAPTEAREFFGAGSDIRQVTGGRVCARTGLFWRSPWRYVGLNGVPHIMKIEGITQ
jgi:hypothetical protein